MSFLGGPECSTGSNPLAQFQKQTQADTSLQRDRLTSRQPGQLNGFRSQQPGPADAAFQNFSQQGPQLGDHLPQDAFHMDQLRREAEHLERSGSATPNWAGEFMPQPGGPGPQFGPAEFHQQMGGAGGGGAGFSPQEFAQFRQSQMSPSHAAQAQQQGPAYTPQTSMYGGGMYGMQRPMFQSQFGGGMGQMPMYRPQQPEQQMSGKGKGRVQELSDTDWERQFEELSSNEQADMDALDQQAERDMEKELNGLDRLVPTFSFGKAETEENDK